MKLRALISLALGFLVACTQKPPMSFEEANVYQKAVYYNDDRPNADKKRDAERKPAEIMKFAGVKPGDSVIELLAGGGWYAELLSDVVGENGIVYVVNTELFNSFAGDDLSIRLKGNRLSNVTRVDSSWNNLQLPTNIDVIWLTTTYHDIYVKRPENPELEANRDHFFEQMRLALKPGGLLLVTDHAAKTGTGLIDTSKLHRIDEDFARQDLENEGFELVRSTDILRNADDDYTKDIWNEAVRGKTDRFVHLYKRKAEEDTAESAAPE